MRIKTFAVVVTTALVAFAAGCGKGEEAAKGGAEPAAEKAGEGGAKAEKKAKKGDYAGSATVANAGTISGTVTYAGDKTDGTVTPTKDTGVCGTDAKPEGAIVVNGGKLKNAIVMIDGIKEGKAFEPGEVVVDNVDCMFQPRVAIAYVGGQIAAKNSDPVLHNTHGYLQPGNKNLFNVALPQKDQVIKKDVKKPGLVDVKCDAHEWMQAYVQVAEHPYVTVTGDDGSFTLSDVPAGEYKLKIWHEKLGEKEASAKVDAGGTATVDVAM